MTSFLATRGKRIAKRTSPGAELRRKIGQSRAGALSLVACDPELSLDERRSAVWKPQPGPQTRALASEATIVGFGGQAGGGKSDLAIGTAILQHERTTIFRREATQTGDLIDRAKSITGWNEFDSEGKRASYATGWNGATKVLTLPTGFIEFAGIKEPEDWKKWQGRPRDLWVFDEAPEFLESQVRSLIGWLRSPNPRQRVRVLLTFNPPTTTEGEWILDLFGPWVRKDHPNPAQDGEIRWFAAIDDRWTMVDGPETFTHTSKTGREESISPISVTFIRAKLSDNSYYGPDYLQRLQSLPEPLRSQVMYGDFDAGKESDRWQIVPTSWVMAAVQRGRTQTPGPMLTKMALDVAHGGKDTTAAARLYGDFIPPLDCLRGVDSPDGKTAAGFALSVLVSGGQRGPDFLLNVDAIGYGASAGEKLSDSIEDGGHGLPFVQLVNVSNATTYRDRTQTYRMANRRAEMYWRLREALDPDNGATLALPDDRELIADLCSVRYKVAAGGVIQVLSKDDIRSKIGRSPDKGDAVALLMLDKIAPIGATNYAPEVY